MQNFTRKARSTVFSIRFFAYVLQQLTAILTADIKPCCRLGWHQVKAPQHCF
jgi:hypothetical protein